MKSIPWAVSLLISGIAGTALAQDSGSKVTLYGAADVGVAHYKTKGQSKTAMHAASAGSRIGFLASEDLGQGNKVNVRLESGLNLDNGTTSSTNGMAGRFWSRQAYIELENSSWGAVRMGRLEGPTYGFFPKFDPMLLPAMDAWGVLTTLGSMTPGAPQGLGKSNGFLINPTQRTDNTIAYISPRWAGVQARLAYSLDEKQAGRAKFYEGSVDYMQGPLTLGALIVKTSSASATGSAPASRDATEYALGASYRKGPVHPYVTYIHRNRTDSSRGSDGAMLNANSESVALVGAVIPVSERGNIRMTMGKYSSGTANSDAKNFGLAYTHELSRRTMVLAAVTHLTQQSGSAWPVFQSPRPLEGASVSGVILGISSRF
jgi:general bacterial porin, GBP family